MRDLGWGIVVTSWIAVLIGSVMTYAQWAKPHDAKASRLCERAHVSERLTDLLLAPSNCAELFNAADVAAAVTVTGFILGAALLFTVIMAATTPLRPVEP
jgi:hypothetical protein